MEIHHIGYLVKNMQKAIDRFAGLGFSIERGSVIDEYRGIDIVFMTNGDYRVELVSPITETSVVANTIKKLGNTPYHLCYYCDNIEETVEALKKEKFMQTDVAAPAPAIDGHRVCFLFNASIGLIELVETNKEKYESKR